MPSARHLALMGLLFVLEIQWPVFRAAGIPLPPAAIAVSSGLTVFAAAYFLSWGGELAQTEIPQSLAIAFMAFVAVLPEYAVDLYLAWTAGSDPAYLRFVAANMTGANRLLIGVGWAAVLFAFFLRTKKGEIRLVEANSPELFALTLATLYSMTIPFKGHLSWIDSAVFLAIFAVYLRRAARTRQTGDGQAEMEGPAEDLARLPRWARLAVTVFFFVSAGAAILLSAEPFAESLIESGRRMGLDQFVLVQWLAPLASEAPEFLIAVLFALRGLPAAGLGALIAAKVNQWTLLVGAIPLVYNLAADHGGPMPLDARQSEEILLTAAQSLFAVVVIANLRFSITEALLLFVLFATQLFFTSTEARHIYAVMYGAVSVGWLLVVPGNLRGFVSIFRPPNRGARP